MKSAPAATSVWGKNIIHIIAAGLDGIPYT